VDAIGLHVIDALQVQEGAELLSERTATEDKKLNKVRPANLILDSPQSVSHALAVLWPAGMLQRGLSKQKCSSSASAERESQLCTAAAY
jgi:hypothetical protein